MSLDPRGAGPGSGGKLLALLAFVCVAAAGVAGGVALDRFVLLPRMFERRGPFGRENGPPSAEARERFRARFAQDLGLSPAQKVTVDSLMARQAERGERLRQRMRPAMDSLVAETRRAMDSVLTPAQRQKLQEMRARRPHRDRGEIPGPGGWGQPAQAPPPQPPPPGL